MTTKKEQMVLTGIRIQKRLKADCEQIAKAMDSDLSKEIRRMLRKFRENNIELLDN